MIPFMVEHNLIDFLKRICIFYLVYRSIVVLVVVVDAVVVVVIVVVEDVDVVVAVVAVVVVVVVDLKQGVLGLEVD